MVTARWARWTAGVGALFVALLVASIFVATTPSTGQSPTKIFTWYLNHNTQLNISGFLTYLSVVAGLWFYASLWRYFRSFAATEAPAAATLLGAVCFAVGGGLGAGINFAAADHTRALGAANVVLLNNLGSDLPFALSIAGLALFYLATGIVVYRARAFPRWLAWVSWVFVVVILVPPIAIIGFFGTPLWLLLVCFLILRLPGRQAEAVAAAHPAPSTLVDSGRSPAPADAEPHQQR